MERCVWRVAAIVLALVTGRSATRSTSPVSTSSCCLLAVLWENGALVRSTTVTIPAQTGAAVQVTAADLVGQ